MTISGAVSRLSRERGERYYSQGAVSIVEGDAWRVVATVQGTRRYEVVILRARDFFEVSCSCPFYDRELTSCKHIWATFLTAEQNGCLTGAGDSTPREIREEIPGLYSYQQRNGRLAMGVPGAADWKQQLHALAGAIEEQQTRATLETSFERQFFYAIDVDDSMTSDQLKLQVAQRTRKADGNWGKLKTQRLSLKEIATLPQAADRRIMAMLVGGREDAASGYSPYYYDTIHANFTLVQPLWDIVLPLMCETGRCVLRPTRDAQEYAVLSWDDGDPWEFAVETSPDDSAQRYLVHGMLKRGDVQMDLKRPALLLAGGLVFYDDRVARLQDYGAFSWLSLMRAQGHLSVPKREAVDFIGELLRLPRRPRLALPEELRFEEVSCRPIPRLVIRPAPRQPRSTARLIADLSFEYEGVIVPSNYPAQSIHQRDRHRVLNRDFAAEAAAEQTLKELGLRSPYRPGSAGEFEFASDRLSPLARILTREGWRIEAEGKLYRIPGAMRIEVNSGVDWFELQGNAQFGETKIALPKLLRAIKRGEDTVRLDDGTLGILPEEWLEKYRLLANLGSMHGNELRFTRQQVGLLDALIASETEVAADGAFARLREELYSFDGITPADPPRTFTGELRDYQREGLGWLSFLQRFGFGGCLADDMGLGKTIQVLALLDWRRELREANEPPSSPGPSLVVVPRSLVFHWKREAGRFAPKLRLLDHTGAARRKPGDHFKEYDLVITTYGTLRSDALQFREQVFDYCILDEAQAIKNPGTLSAKAARLLRADHRLALSGTPVENHLGELWSLFDFLNPGMLGNAGAFRSAGRNPDTETREILVRALRPFILRRTKGQVARELPEKTEQTLFVDLSAREQKLYDELRVYYRARLLKDVAQEEMSRVKFQALEALLRLRQAACHPGLIDKNKAEEPSAKVDTLIEQLEQVLEEGHKVLVFSQFTSLLAILRMRLDRTNTRYVYLDGRTRDRQVRIEEFQNDPDLKLFLISLKAGGLGLNLHAAEYVYLLDPWWNPAVEAQAIDRAHRIGQTRRVFAYRLIARGTVEEKVLQLQQSKRDLADAIITADNSLVQNLTREDLELLLS